MSSGSLTVNPGKSATSPSPSVYSIVAVGRPPPVNITGASIIGVIIICLENIGLLPSPSFTIISTALVLVFGA